MPHMPKTPILLGVFRFCRAAAIRKPDPRRPGAVRSDRRAKQDMRLAFQPRDACHKRDSRTKTQSSAPEPLLGSGLNRRGPAAGKGEPLTVEN
jgi:hypothetical protein